MLTLVANVTSYAYKLVFGKKERSDNKIEDIVYELEKATINEIPKKRELIPSDTEGGFYANGTITTIAENFVIINDKYYCDIYNVLPKNLTVGNKVKYLAYQLDNDKERQVSKIISINDQWQEEMSEEENQEETVATENIEKQKVIKKVIVQKVIKRDKRLAYAGDICVDLNKVTSQFVPLIGDWIKINCLVVVNPESPESTEEILKIQEIHPLRLKHVSGIITNFDNKYKTGSINKQVIFHKGAISCGYVPCVGDAVIGECIESEQDFFSWRAISVVPLNKRSVKPEAGIANFCGFQMPHNMEELTKNKNGIEIENKLKVDLEMNEEKELKVAVLNTSYMSHMITTCVSSTSEDKSQLRLIKPDMNSKIILNEGEIVTYIFKCKAKHIGKSIEIIQFSFKRFQIARAVEINVKAKHLTDRNNADVQFDRNMILSQDDNDSETRIPGVRTFKSSPFAVSNGVFKVPQVYWDVVLRLMNNKIPLKEAKSELIDALPNISPSLTYGSYAKHFHSLLYLEEITSKLILQMYNMDSVIFKSYGEYLVMNVPGIVEKRPSLIVNDKVVVQLKCITDNKKYEGYIHKIIATDIYVKFNQLFHEKYCNTDCKVSFIASTGVIQRCHRAVNSAVAIFDQQFLFPVQVIEKEPQYVLEDIENTDSIENNYVNEFSATNCFKDPNDLVDSMNNREIVNYYKNILKRKKLEWFNKKLNKYQKEAVKNILMGVARPLPYVIFGPPGTGKTITLCETILQIFNLIPNSRILVATPSNSSANLIAERLLEYDVLKPGDLVRLVARYYMDSDAISPYLLPYCATADLTAVNGKRSNEINSKKNSYNSAALGRHRITIGTCAALGILYNLNFKPGHFTHLLVDEAGQATEPEIMIPLTMIDPNSGQVILAGDPQQLGPIVQSKYANEFGYAQSFLDRLLQRYPYQRDFDGFEHGYDPRLVTKLLINYRSLPDILDLPNQLFYDAELIPRLSATDSEEAKILEILKTDLPNRGDASPPSIVFHGVNGVNRQDKGNPSWYNVEEATQIFIYFLRFSEKGFNADDVGIITPYKKQVSEIRNLLSELEVDIPKVGTVEEFQGQERKIIMLSTVRSVDELVSDDIKHNLGFVSEPRRLNVAITRARALLIIVGNPFLLSKDSYWRSVLDYCIKKNSYTGCNLQYNLNLNTTHSSLTTDEFI